MGRVLISMNLIPHEKPDFGKEILTGSLEPDRINYCLRVNILELQLNTGHNECWIDVKFGPNSEHSKKVKSRDANRSDDYRNFKFKGAKGTIKEIKGIFPVETNQVPDIFLNIFVSKMMSIK